MACGMRYHTTDALTPDEFFGLLSDAFETPAPPFVESLRGRYVGDGSALAALPPFTRWGYFLTRQIVDLREMSEGGQLANKLRYFGIDSPRGSRWYNFDVCTYLECATVGSFGGWEPGDGTGREYVPGEVVVTNPDGTLGSADPRDLPNPVEALTAVTWDDFYHFLGQGQWYE